MNDDEPVCMDCGGEVGIGPDGKPYRRCMQCNAKRKKAEPPYAVRPAPKAAAPAGTAFKADPAKLEAEAKRSAQVRRQACINSALTYHSGKMPAVKEVLKTAEELEAWVVSAKP